MSSGTRAKPKTVAQLWAALEKLVPGFAMEEVGENNELWIYTGLKVDDDGKTLIHYEKERADA